MVYKTLVSNRAKGDLNNILLYIAEKLGNRKAAVCFAEAVDETYDRLAAYPEMYSLSLGKRLAARGFRRAIIENFVMLYRVDEKNQEVLVARYFYGRRDYGKYL